MKQTFAQTGFRHQDLRVYQHSLLFSRWVNETAGGLPRGYGDLKNQLVRASNSIALNIAEGSQQHSRAMGRKYYRIAIASAAECSAALDLLTAAGIAATDEGQQLLGSIGKMLNRLAA